LDNETKWRDDGYPEKELIRRGYNNEELHLTYDGFKKKVTVHNPTSKASYHIVY
jgi:hypothetical protein